MLKKIFEMTKKQIIIIISCLIGLIIIITGSILFLNKEEEQKICTIIFNTNGGTLIQSKKIDCKNKIEKPENPNKEGFDFIDWYYNEEKFDFETIITRDITLDAKYEKQAGIETVFITLDTGTENKNIIEIKKGSLLPAPEDPIMNGYIFEGWYFNYEKFDFNTPINEDLELKAKFIKKEENVNISNSSNTNNNNNSKYKCSGSFRTDVPEKNVTIGYQDHVNWTWSTYGISGGEKPGVCYNTYKTSDASIASVSETGIIKALKSGTVYIYSCINDTETKDELICFKGKLNIVDEHDNQTVLTEKDKIVNKYVGMWYLEGYADIYIDITKYKNYGEYMSINPRNFNIETGEKYPTGCGNIPIYYSNWDNDLRKYGITLNNDKIIIQTGNNKYTFTRTKGTKDKYTGKLFHKLLGKWYLFNNPESYINVTFNDGFYCLNPYKFDLNTLKTNSWSDRCDIGTSDKLILDLGITVENDILTITNSYGTAKFYKTQKVVEVESITINKTKLELLKGHEETLTAHVNPLNAYYKDIIWTSSNPSVATVDNNGKVTAINKGTAVITASSKDNKKSAQCTVTVTFINVEGITLNKNNTTIIKGQTETLVATILPNNASNTNYSWTSSNPSVATVDKNGKITGIKKGTATITITTEDGNHQADCVVEIVNPPLTADASIGLSFVTTSSGMYRGVNVTINASGGSENYTYYYIKLYKDGTLIGQSSNTNDDELFIVGFANGTYTAEFEVRDSENNVYKGTKSTQISVN